MPRRLLALSLLFALTLAAFGCGRNAGLPPKPGGSTRAEGPANQQGDDLNPRTDPQVFPATGNRGG